MFYGFHMASVTLSVQRTEKIIKCDFHQESIRRTRHTRVTHTHARDREIAYIELLKIGICVESPFFAYLLHVLVLQEQHVRFVPLLPESQYVIPDGSDGRLALDEQVAKLVERTVQTVNQFAIVVIRHAHVFGVTRHVDDFRFHFVQLFGQQRHREMRLDEPGRRHVFHLFDRVTQLVFQFARVVSHESCQPAT